MMPLDEREHDCVLALCKHLTDTPAVRVWNIIDDDVDRWHPNEPSPDAIIGNGSVSMAVEVKSLRGPGAQTRFYAVLISLRELLSPPQGGHYFLSPPFDCSPPWDRPFVRRLQREIERIAPTLGEREGYVTIPKSAYLIRQNERGSSVSCFHRGSLPDVRGRVSGTYLLIDEAVCEHTFYTDEIKDAFVMSIVSAAQEVARGSPRSTIEWLEEWPISKTESVTPMVEVVATAGAFNVSAAVQETIWTMLAAADKKFHRRWADIHAVVLDKRFFFANTSAATEALQQVPPPDYARTDAIYLFDEGNIYPLFARSG